MKIGLWILQGLLALAMLGAGGMKISQSREAMLANPQMAWATDFSETQIKLIGTAEIAGGLGLVLPQALSILPILTPVAAGALSVLMFGAAATHIQRNEPAAAPAVLGVLCLLVVAGQLMVRRRGTAVAQRA